MDLKKQRIEMAVTGLMLGLASYLQYIAYHTKARTTVQGMQSMTFPKIILYLMMFLCAVTLIRGIITYRRLKKEMTSAPSASQKGQATKIIVTILLIVVYAAMWNVIGFFVSTLIFFFVESMLLDTSFSWKKAALLSILYATVVYAVFGLCFNVSFPEPILDMILN